MTRTTRMGLVVLLALCLLPAAGLSQQAGKQLREPDVIYVPTPQDVVDAMLKMAEVRSGDVVYDLGCGDGRVVVTAAKQYGVRGVGIDINPERIAEARENVQKNGVGNRITLRNEDLFEADIKEASVVTLYLLTSLNLKLRPKLWSDLKPGTRIVSHSFDMGDWKPAKEMVVSGHTIYLWRVPENAGKAN
ncbi:MAG TPA: class I SAM-dependent methyltransferase [Bryobacteraceae bacterium]|nr:class I SAM-dependent methyltransferase [Bryobacteraceae bacterium]